MGEGNAWAERWPLWPLLTTLWLPFPSSVSDGAGGCLGRLGFLCPVGLYPPAIMGKTLGWVLMGSTRFCVHPSVCPSNCPFLHSSIHPSVSLPSSRHPSSHSLTLPAFFPSTFTSPSLLPPFLLSFPPSSSLFPSIVPSFHLSFHPFILSFPSFLCSFHPLFFLSTLHPSIHPTHICVRHCARLRALLECVIQPWEQMIRQERSS